MSVPCPGCGREYDVTLFEFGRTIHCTCGRRVGLEPRVREWTDSETPRFMADVMLERLAHWLRISGFDCAHEARIDDAALVRRALEERRIILTRDSTLPEEWRIAGIYLVSAKTPLRQLREVIREFDLSESVRLFRRCSRCNARLVDATREQVEGRVPGRILASQERFRRCPDCERVYWEGSHTSRIRRTVQASLARRR